MPVRLICVASRRLGPVAASAALCLALAHCSDRSRIDPRYGVAPSERLVEDGEAVPKGGGVYRVGSPYMVGGKVYVPTENPRYRADGLASWYGSDFRGRSTANGEIFDHDGITAAHTTMPLPSYARVTNLSNGRSLIVRVNDRGPFAANRIIDVSKRAADLLGFANHGTAWVRVEYVGRAPISGSDDRLLETTLRQDEPAPAPDQLKLAAATRIVPVTMTLPPSRHTRLASAAVGDPPTVGTLPNGAASPSEDGTDQFLNGRGLY